MSMKGIRVTDAQYGELVKKASPNSHIGADCARAFLVGGIICALGEGIIKLYLRVGADKELAGLLTSATLVFLAALLTGFGWYEKLGKYAGAGSLVPITGFANAIAAPAIEFKKEGFIFGVGAKMFVVAGPVIVYGTLASVVVGAIYFFVR